MNGRAAAAAEDQTEKCRAWRMLFLLVLPSMEPPTNAYSACRDDWAARLAKAGDEPAPAPAPPLVSARA